MQFKGYEHQSDILYIVSFFEDRWLVAVKTLPLCQHQFNVNTEALDWNIIFTLVTDRLDTGETESDGEAFFPHSSAF